MLGVRWRTHSSASCEAACAPSFGITVCRCSTWTVGCIWAEACNACVAGPQMHQARFAERRSQFLSQVVPEHQPLMPSNVLNFSPGFLHIAAAECSSAYQVIRAFLDNLQNVCGKGKLCRFKGFTPEYLPRKFCRLNEICLNVRGWVWTETFVLQSKNPSNGEGRSYTHLQSSGIWN